MNTELDEINKYDLSGVAISQETMLDMHHIDVVAEAMKMLERAHQLLKHHRAENNQSN